VDDEAAEGLGRVLDDAVDERDRAAAPAIGIEMSWAGTRARARSMRFWPPRSAQVSGGDEHTSNTARGRAASASGPPASIARSSIIAWIVGIRNAPVTIGLSAWRRTMNSR